MGEEPPAHWLLLQRWVSTEVEFVYLCELFPTVVMNRIVHTQYVRRLELSGYEPADYVGR